MKSIRFHSSKRRQRGLSLMEVMVSMALFSIGALGIAASTASAIKANADNQARAMALSAATKTLEPVYLRAKDPYATGEGVENLQAVIKKYLVVEAKEATEGEEAVEASAGMKVLGNVAAGSSDDFMVSITQAVDAAGTNVLTNAGPYVSPIRVGVLVKYHGAAGRKNSRGVTEVDQVKEVYTSFTYVLGG